MIFPYKGEKDVTKSESTEPVRNLFGYPVHDLPLEGSFVFPAEGERFVRRSYKKAGKSVSEGRGPSFAII